MNIGELKSIINSGLPERFIELKIIDILSKDKNVIPIIMQILDQERKLNKEISEEMNLLLSKAHIGLNDKELNKNDFMQKEITDFYLKYNGHVTHCFKKI